jgi:hypothetical protein
VDQPSLVKDEMKEEEAPVRLEVVVYNSSGTQAPMQMGYVTQEQILGVNNMIRTAFETLAPTKCLTIVDEVGCTRHFNINHVTYVEVRIR